MSNRVEKLESQVAELQAAVDGLTEELVETRERLRQLEASAGVDESRAPAPRGGAEGGGLSPGSDEGSPADGTGQTDPADGADHAADPPEEAEETDSDGSDIIVA